MADENITTQDAEQEEELQEQEEELQDTADQQYDDVDDVDDDEVEDDDDDVDDDNDDVDDDEEDESDDDIDDAEPQKQSAKDRNAKKKAENEAKKEKSRMKKEWEDSIVASKRVKREEHRRKLKQAMLIMLVFALIVTSVVYIMLLFIQENNVRITASTKDKNKSIALSMDGIHWTPYLNAEGPDNMWDVSYNKVYDREPIYTINEVRDRLQADDYQLGPMNGDDYICFGFMLKNTGEDPAIIDYEMTLENDDHNMQDAIRVVWGESFRSDDVSVEDNRTSIDVYAALSYNDRLANTNINSGRTKEDGYLEYVAYPIGSDNPSFDLVRYEAGLADYQSIVQAREAGYFETTPFFNSKYIFQRQTTLEKGDIMYCYVCIWLEGSDFDCVNAILGGFCKIGVNFTAS